ncbi:MAG: VOC family protein [Lachnospiraceae bacterium]|nr:VOC family protein [Lachnospiraceae bacterium]
MVKPLMKRQKNSPYHICYECEDLEAAIDELRAKGFVAWADPHVAPALGKSRVCFLIHPHAGMIELYETKDK